MRAPQASSRPIAYSAAVAFFALCFMRTLSMSPKICRRMKMRLLVYEYTTLACTDGSFLVGARVRTRTKVRVRATDRVWICVGVRVRVEVKG